MEVIQTHIADRTLTTVPNLTQTQNANFSQVLKEENLAFAEDTHYFQVGALPGHGWIFYLSVIRTQYAELLSAIIPLLARSCLAFKMAKNTNIVKSLLDGELGINIIGQLIVIYLNEEDPLSYAKELVRLTNQFRGPSVPATRYLGGSIYTSYNKGENQHNTYSKDSDSITWPFTELAPENLPAKKQLWNNKYRPLEIIKFDPKGRVIKANYFKGFLNIQLCIIKEGIKNMWADDFDRDIIDRIKWQYELYQDLEGKVPTPKIIDLFDEGNNTYLAMEFIKGDSLSSKILEIITEQCWSSLATTKRVKLLNYLIKITSIIEELHKLGYVHRDITPVNFMINKKEEIFLIDMELTYSFNRVKPEPAFRLGTPGYISPEQFECETPTTYEDTYALGALMIFCLTGLPPIKFDTRDDEGLYQHLEFFIKSKSLSSLIASCLSHAPHKRPSIQYVKSEIELYKNNLQIEPIIQRNISLYCKRQNGQELESLISKYLKDLSANYERSSNHLWNSLDWQTPIPGMVPNTRYPQTGLYTGMTGVLYLLARAKQIGYDITSCIQAYKTNWEYIQSNCLEADENRSYGLYYGLGGIALALKAGLESGLLTDPKYTGYLQGCFDGPEKSLTISSGAAGQGLSLLKCYSRVNPELSNPLLDKYLDAILGAQLNDGSWAIKKYEDKRKEKIIGWGHGIAGMIYFLLMNAVTRNDSSANAQTQNALKWLSNKIKNKNIELNSFDFGIPGIVLTYIKAYEVFHDPIYKISAESLIAQLPNEPVYFDYTQSSGLAGLGEMYLEASRVFQTDQWEKTVDWIASLFIHTQIKSDEGLGYWASSIYPEFDIDLMSGSSGIIHFLMRYQKRNELGHVLLS